MSSARIWKTQFLGFLFLIISGISLGFSQKASADVYRVIDDEQAALQIRVDLIQQARKSLDLAYFIWGDDTTSRQILGLLRDAARRGVKVRVLVDSMFNAIPAATRLSLAQEGVIIKDYNPFKILDSKTWAHRMHNKLFFVDGELLVMGGRNIEDDYFGLAPSNYHDRDVLIRGKAVEKALKYYNSLWEAPIVAVLIKKLKGRTVQDAERDLDLAMAELRSHRYLKLDTGTDWTEGEIERPEVRFLHDDLGVIKERIPIYDQLTEMALNAKESLVIETGYLVVTKALLKTFQTALDRGVKIRILTNSLNSTDGLPAQAAYIGKKKKLVRMGIELYEYTGDHHLHIKSGVVDGKFAVIGSYNLDPLSANRNTETVSYIEDEELAQEILTEMDSNLNSAVRINDRGKPEGSKTRFPGVPWSKIAKTYLLRYLMVPES